MKILICSDGHHPAERSVRFIAGIASSCAAQVTLLGIIEHPTDEAPLAESLRRSAGILRDKGIAVETITRSGMPLQEIQKRTHEERYDLVVIGAERKNGGPFALSAKAYHLIKEVDPPVLVMIGERATLKNVLICSGGGAYIEKAVQLTAELACKSPLSVTILHVLPQAPIVYSALGEEESNSSHLLASNTVLARHLKSDLAALGAKGIQAQLKLRQGLVSAEIIAESEEGDYDLIVAGTAPAGGRLRTYVMGNVTSEIVNKSNCPVLVVRGELPKARKGILERITSLFSRK